MKINGHEVSEWRCRTSTDVGDKTYHYWFRELGFKPNSIIFVESSKYRTSEYPDKWMLYFSDQAYDKIYYEMFGLGTKVGFNKLSEAKDTVDLFLKKLSKLPAFI